MGKWRNRVRFQRQNPQQRYYDEAQPLDSGLSDDSIPSWEKKFCYLIGDVPWRKVVAVKMFVPRDDSVLSWNDSAGKEAFWNAKKRFWADYNGVDCDITLSEPDVYLDEINWDVEIDPELLKDLEAELCDADKKKMVSNEEVVPKEGQSKNPEVRADPWEGQGGCCDKASENKEGLDPWDTAVNEVENRNDNDNDNPWEYQVARSNDFPENSAGKCSWDKTWGCNQERNVASLTNIWRQNDSKGWPSKWQVAQCSAFRENDVSGGSGNNTWGRNQQRDFASQSNGWDQNDSKGWPLDQVARSNAYSWNDVRGGVGNNTRGWGRGRNDSKGWDDSGKNSRSWKFTDSRNLRSDSNYCKARKDREWGASAGRSWGPKQWQNNHNESTNRNRSNSRDQWTWNSNYRKREGSHLNVSTSRSSRCKRFYS